MFYYPTTDDSYSIIYNNLKGANNSANPKSFTLADKITLKNISLSGFTFNGWFDASTDGNKIIGWNAGEQTADVVLWARWTPIASHTITYNGVDGATHSNPSTFTESDDITLTDATKSGFTFAGWFDASTDGNQIIGWTSGTLIGALGASIFSSRLLSSLGIALYTMFIALLVPDAKKSKAIGIVILLSKIKYFVKKYFFYVCFKQ